MVDIQAGLAVSRKPTLVCEPLAIEFWEFLAVQKQPAKCLLLSYADILYCLVASKYDRSWTVIYHPTAGESNTTQRTRRACARRSRTPFNLQGAYAVRGGA